MGLGLGVLEGKEREGLVGRCDKYSGDKCDDNSRMIALMTDDRSLRKMKVLSLFVPCRYSPDQSQVIPSLIISPASPAIMYSPKNHNQTSKGQPK